MGSVIEEFKMQGLSLRGDAMAAVVSFLDRSEDADAALSQMLDALDTKVANPIPLNRGPLHP
jgi:hypothetical protein